MSPWELFSGLVVLAFVGLMIVTEVQYYRRIHNPRNPIDPIE